MFRFCLVAVPCGSWFGTALIMVHYMTLLNLFCFVCDPLCLVKFNSKVVWGVCATYSGYTTEEK